MYRLEYEDDLCRELVSFFITEQLAYSWIKMQNGVRQWCLFDDNDCLIKSYINPQND